MQTVSIAEKMKRGELPNPYELTYEDVGKYLCPDFGAVIPSDVGHLVFLQDGLASMESNEQLRARRAMAER